MATVMNNPGSIRARKFMTHRLLQWKQSLSSFTLARQQHQRQELGGTSRNVQDHTRWMPSLCLDSEPILVVVARQLALAWFVIPWIMHRKGTQTSTCKTCVGLSEKKTSRKRCTECKNRMKQVGALERPVLAKSELEGGQQRNKDCSRTLSAVTVQIFHETITKRKAFT